MSIKILSTISRASTRTVMCRASSLSAIHQRTFMVTTYHLKTVTESVKETAKVVDKTLGQKAAKGLEGLERVRDATVDTAQSVTGKAQAKGNEVKADAHHKAKEVKHDVKSNVHDAADKIKKETR